jgi:hypothetical protein
MDDSLNAAVLLYGTLQDKAPAENTRICETLKSGARAWVYVRA